MSSWEEDRRNDLHLTALLIPRLPGKAGRVRLLSAECCASPGSAEVERREPKAPLTSKANDRTYKEGEGDLSQWRGSRSAFGSRPVYRLSGSS
jgi:hypothetical protein